MNEKDQKIYDNLTTLKALEEVDKDLAIKVISAPDLDHKELSLIIEYSLMGKFVFTKTNEPLKLCNEVIMAGIRNRLNQIAHEATEDKI